MTATVGDRHLLDFDGRRVDDRTVSVSIELVEEFATLPACQHALWAAVNMLARLEGVVSEVLVRGPKTTKVAGRISPHFQAGASLLGAVIDSAGEIGSVGVSMSTRRADVELVVGPGGPVSDALRVHGDGWTGGVSKDVDVSLGPARHSPSVRTSPRRSQLEKSFAWRSLISIAFLRSMLPGTPSGTTR